jgi:uridylate kinase
MKTIIISLGGSLVAPEKNFLATRYLLDFKKLIIKFSNKIRFIIIVGGGQVCRFYQDKARSQKIGKNDLDWIGIFAARLNATFVRSFFGKKAYSEILLSPLDRKKIKENIVFSSAWIPGWTTDYDCVKFCQTRGAKEILNLTNINYIYNKDPRKFNDAKLFKELSWSDYLKIIGKKRVPGGHYPFDPVASSLAKKLKIRLISINGLNLKAVENYLTDKKFVGTIVK